MGQRDGRGIKIPLVLNVTNFSQFPEPSEPHMVPSKVFILGQILWIRIFSSICLNFPVFLFYILLIKLFFEGKDRMDQDRVWKYFPENYITILIIFL